MSIAKLWLEPIQGYDPWRSQRGATFDPRIARRVIKFFEGNFSHSKGEFSGKKFVLERWQKKVLGHTFAWKRPDGTRRYRKLFIYLPRKNGKTTMVAAMGLLMLTADDEPGAEIYCAAAETDQAAIVFKEASSMVRQNPDLDSEIRIYDGYKAMKFDATGSYWKVLSSEAGTKHGLNPHAYIVDEVHVQKNSDLMEALETGVGARRQPLGVYLTTADYSGDSPCNRMVDYARKVRDGGVDDPEYLPVIYEALPDKDDWKDEEVWWRVNPNLGVSVKLDYLRSQFRKAIEEPSFENTFKRLHLNMQTEQERRWLKMEDWDGSGLTLDKAALAGRECFAGLDLSSTQDITAFVLYFPDECACLSWFWVPAKTAKKKIEYEVWARQGYVTITDGNVIDYEAVRTAVKETSGIYKILDIGYDPWNATQIAKTLADTDGLPMMEFRQGYKSMNEPAKELEKLIVQRKLVHFGNPVLRWMASNAQVSEDPAGNIKPVKAQKDSPKKIDGIVALTMAVGLSMTHEAKDKSAYDQSPEEMDKLLKEIYK